MSDSQENPQNDDPTPQATEENNPSEAARKRFASGKSHVAKAAEDIRAAAEAKAQELRETAEIKAQELRTRAESVYGDYRTRARTFREDGEQYIRENPLRAVMTALGVGFVLGMIFRR